MHAIGVHFLSLNETAILQSTNLRILSLHGEKTTSWGLSWLLVYVAFSWLSRLSWNVTIETNRTPVLRRTDRNVIFYPRETSPVYWVVCFQNLNPILSLSISLYLIKMSCSDPIHWAESPHSRTFLSHRVYTEQIGSQLIHALKIIMYNYLEQHNIKMKFKLSSVNPCLAHSFPETPSLYLYI